MAKTAGRRAGPTPGQESPAPGAALWALGLVTGLWLLAMIALTVVALR